MDKKTKNSIDDEIRQKLEYLGLDLDKIPENIQEYEPLKFRVSKKYEENKYRQYRFVSIKDLQILLSPTNRMDDLDEKYSKASPIYSYLVPDTEEKMQKHATFLKMLAKVRVEDIEAVEEEQKKLARKIPFKVKYPGNYLWQIYYSEATDKYFMLVPTEDSDYSTFFYVLKKQLEKKKAGRVYVPISHIQYSNRYLEKGQFEDIENYLWLFTKDWPLVYEVKDKNDRLSIQIVGETQSYKNIKTQYKIKLSDEIESTQFYKLLKAMFVLQTELPHYYNFTTDIDRQGELEFYLNNNKIEYGQMTEFIKEQYLEVKKKQEKAIEDIKRYKEKLENLKILAVQLEIDYIAKEKQISTFLECKKSFFGKVKYFFKYSKKKETKIPIEEIEEVVKEDTEEIEEKNDTIKKYYNLEELIEKYKEFQSQEEELKNIVMDINALKLKNKNLTKKIENASLFIQEIDSHKKSIFEFWKYSNKDEVQSLAEGEAEEITSTIKITKTFEFDEDKEKFGEEVDNLQRKNLTKDETNSLFITTTDVIDIINDIKVNSITPKQIDNNLKQLKEELKDDKNLLEKDEFDVFGSIINDKTKIKVLANKKHREIAKDKFSILDINKETTNLGYKLTLEKIISNVASALEKNTTSEEIPIYKASYENKLDASKINLFNLDISKEIKETFTNEESKINLFKINLPKGANAVFYTNIIYYDNKNRTLPAGMDIDSKVLVDLSKLKLKLKQKISFRIAKFEDEKDELSKLIVKTVNVFEYDFEEDIETEEQ